MQEELKKKSSDQRRSQVYLVFEASNHNGCPQSHYELYKNHAHLLKFLLFGSPILNLLSTKNQFLTLKKFFPPFCSLLTLAPGTVSILTSPPPNSHWSSLQNQAGRQRVLIICLLHLLFLPCRPNMTIFRHWTSLIIKL